MHIAVVGGGLTGLVAACDLLATGADVTLLYDGLAPGGQIRTRHDRGFVVDDGAEGFVASDTAVPELCRELGLSDLILPQATRRALMLEHGGMRELPPREAATLLGIPVDAEAESTGVASLRGGMGALTDAVVRAITPRARIRPATRVMACRPHAGRWTVEVQHGRPVTADGVVLATTPPEAARLLREHEPGAAGTLLALQLHSSVSVSLGYATSSVTHALDASGFVVHPYVVDAQGVRACAFASSKFPDRAPGGSVLLRAFFRPPPNDATRPDDEWIGRAHHVLAAALDIRADPVAAWVAHWPGAIPQIDAAQRLALREASTRVRGLGGIELAGAPFGGGGVPGAVRSGRAAARSMVGSRTTSLPA